MIPTLGGLHHITAVAGNPQENFAFYTGTLGLRLIKRTINYDDPGTYHLYYGDGAGSPGTLLTFFPWPGASRGKPGAGQQTATALAVSQTALPYWRERLTGLGIAVTDAGTRFGSQVLSFADPHGLALEIVGTGNDDLRPGWAGSDVPAEHAIRGVDSITLTERVTQPTAELLTETLGFRHVATEGMRSRYALADGLPGQVVDILHAPDAPQGQPGAGIVHHAAFRTADDDQQELWLAVVRAADIPVSDVRDRQYFHSIYFHEPGRVLFEVATDNPGFATDEDSAHLGEKLCLPTWLEAHRVQIERSLPPLS